MDLYFFRRGLRSYFNAGYRFKNEHATADNYDNRSHSLKVRYVHRFDILQRIVKLEFSWRYEGRDYTSITPDIGEERSDQRKRWKVDVEIPVSTNSALQIYGGYGDYDSNYPQADYTQGIAGTRILYRW
jgi:hypothetical protein